ncbi:MAG: hypothetical protein ACFFG0_37020 [Candidatus Thorarchaeota archaeon]
MSKYKFYDIVKMDDIQISIPHTSHFSIGTSPYYAHQHGLAIDIYQNLTLKNYLAFSPTSGTILKVKTLAAPHANFANGINKDFLILMSNPSNSNIVWKIMHLKPGVKVGDEVDIGDPLGETIRNGYFAYWSSPHLHLEIRPVNDAIRARGGKSFSLAFKYKNAMKNLTRNGKFHNIPIEIDSIFPEFILARLPKRFYHSISPIYGIKVHINNRNCLLDGGIPHYKVGTVHSDKNHKFKKLNSIYLGTHKIGIIHEITGDFGFFKFEPVCFLLNNKEIRGMSLYLANFLPLIKLIPFKKNEFSFKPKTIQYLSINSQD